ncbi:MAG: aldo/keto reductase, partial [Bacteroidota bacterium]
MNRKITRRRFLKSAAGAGLAISAITERTVSAKETLPHRPLGSTGLEVTILGLGCVAIGYGHHSVSEGAEIVHACIDQGINYIDCASSYGNAEAKVGEVMRMRRKEVVLATK